MLGGDQEDQGGAERTSRRRSREEIEEEQGGHRGGVGTREEIEEEQGGDRGGAGQQIEEVLLGGDRGADGGGRSVRGAEEDRLYPGLGAGGELHCNIHITMHINITSMLSQAFT